eukprot:4497593-Amphidinium_carterae.1
MGALLTSRHLELSLLPHILVSDFAHEIKQCATQRWHYVQRLKGRHNACAFPSVARNGAQSELTRPRLCSRNFARALPLHMRSLAAQTVGLTKHESAAPRLAQLH